MTTNWPAVRAAAVPTALLVATAAFFLTNDVPSADAARSLAGTVSGWPGWGQRGVEVASEGGLLVLAALLAAVAWRARCRGPRPIATVVLGGAGVVLALAVSEVVKVLAAQDRPCRAVPDLDAVASCPPVGDWSLPSNHATLAAALAAALIWSAPRLWSLAVPLAGLVAVARVGLGVHYPHDVADGLVLGAVVVSSLVVLLRRAARRWVAVAAGVPVLAGLLGGGRWPAGAEQDPSASGGGGDDYASRAP